MRTLALNGAGVFAFDERMARGGAVGCARRQGVAVLADARIDGRDELGRALGIEPAEALSAPPAELIARAWSRWGEESPARLVGDYAFLVWEAERQSLSLVRDYFGERPLHYRAGPQGLVAASLPSAIAAADGGARPDIFTLARYHALLPQSGPESFFEGVQRVEPGTVVRWRGGRIDIRRYWHPPRDEIRISREEAAEEVTSILRAAVGDRCRGAATVAAHLSAGMDSSAVAATLGESGARATVITGEEADRDPAPPGYIDSEAPIAAATASLYPTLTHVVAQPEPKSTFDLMEDWNRRVDQPVRSMENAGWIDATYREAARAGADLLMTGGFGNNSFSYDGWAYLADLLRRGRIAALRREGAAMRRVHGTRWRGVAAFALGPLIPEILWRRYRKLPGWRDGLVRLTLFRPGHPILEELRERAIADRHDMAERPARSSWFARANEVGWVDSGLFDHGPRSRWGVTITDPMADRRLVEFTLRLPGDQWIEEGRTRALARRVLAGRVDPRVIDRPGRGMQGSGWRKAAEAALPDLRAEVRRMEGTAWGDLLDLPRVAGMLEDWPASGWSEYDQLFLYRATLMRSITMGHFARVRGG